MAEKLMHTDKELELIKDTFCENEELLKTMRHLWFGMELSPAEKANITETFANKELIEAVRHKVYGLNNFNTPIGQLSDFWVGIEKQIFGASKDTIKQAVESKVMVFEMFTKAFNLLSNPDGEKVDVTFMPSTTDELQVGLIARNLYMQAIETALISILTIAGQKGETLEQTLKRLKQDSAK